MRLSDFALKQQKKLYGGSRIRVLAIYVSSLWDPSQLFSPSWQYFFQEEVVVNYFKFEDVNVYHYPPGVAMELLRHIGNKYGIQ